MQRCAMKEEDEKKNASVPAIPKIKSDTSDPYDDDGPPIDVDDDNTTPVTPFETPTPLIRKYMV